MAPYIFEFVPQVAVHNEPRIEYISLLTCQSTVPQHVAPLRE